MAARRLSRDLLLVMRRAEGPGGLIGEGMVEIGPDDPEYAGWAEYLDSPRKADVDAFRAMLDLEDAVDLLVPVEEAPE